MTVLVSLKIFFGTTRKDINFFALGPAIKTSLEINHTKKKKKNY